ncbi:aspartate kinase [Clostridiales bacterium COT073_COT-073]|nr:aspartate kinase [Clostridiales bacterium COT073_COT-073]
MKIIIQKFGGTSMADENGRSFVLEKIKKAKTMFDGVVVVVSAMGRMNSPYATDTLLSLLKDNKDSLSKREIDLLMGTGEIISAVVLSGELQKIGIAAEAYSGGRAGIITDNNYTGAEVLSVDATILRQALENGITPIVAGFQGRSLEGELATLGRGGSDLSAALLGEALEAEKVEIYTDVDGIMTTDPKLCAEAVTLEGISYNEVFQMADSGAKVIHKKAVEVARRAGIPLIIKNTFSSHAGTAITEYRYLNQIAKSRPITAVACRSERLQCRIEGRLDDTAFFEELAEKGVSIDIINVFPDLRAFTIDQEKKAIAEELLRKYQADYTLIENCTKITLIGEGMTGVPGVMARIITALSQKGILILQTADSLSTIACLIASQDTAKAVEALHQAFALNYSNLGGGGTLLL